MGNKYIEKDCSSCKKVTIHRVFRKFGSKLRDGPKRLRRIVTYCLNCQKRIIDNTKKRHNK